MVLKEAKVSFLVTDAVQEHVKDPGSLDSSRALPGPAYFGRCTPGQGCGYCVLSPVIAPMLLEVVAADDPAAELQEEAHYVPLPPALLAVDLEQLNFPQ